MKRIVIFGAASAIALEAARTWAKEKASFFLVARNAKALADIADDLKARGAAGVATEVADLSVLEGLEAICDRALAHLGRIDVALIAHGALPNPSDCEASVVKALDVMRLNAMSPMALMLKLRLVMKAQGNGTLVIISSVAGDRGRPSNYVYGASKAMLSVLGEGMALELAKTGIKVLVVKPGFVDTPMTASFQKGPLWASPRAVGAAIASAVNAGKSGVLYTPFWWRMVMLIVRFAPGFVVRRM